jgi:hypothetical protein
MSTFDVSKFAVTNAQQQSTVKDFYITETSPIAIEDVAVATADSLNVVFFTFLMLFPSAICIWWNSEIRFMWVALISFLVVGIMGLSRYDHQTRGLRERTTKGQISWEQSKSENKSSAKAEIRFFRDGTEREASVTSVIKSSCLSIQQIHQLAVEVVGSGKFTQDLVTKSAQISAKSYQAVASELMDQGLINFKGENSKQGYVITKLGYRLFGQMVADGRGTPLLVDQVEN